MKQFTTRFHVHTLVRPRLTAFPQLLIRFLSDRFYYNLIPTIGLRRDVSSTE